MDTKRFPIGQFIAPAIIERQHIEAWIAEIEALPQQLNTVVAGLSETQLSMPYRVGGWQVRQVIHHLADSHMNSYIRFKLALTEDNPTIKPYREEAWAELSDTRHAPVADAIMLIEGLHRRWAHLLRSLSASDWERTFFHPESQKQYILKEVAGIYAWHGRHHLAQITSLFSGLK